MFCFDNEFYVVEHGEDKLKNYPSSVNFDGAQKGLKLLRFKFYPASLTISDLKPIVTKFELRLAFLI
jgi:hypothetical protein